MDASAWNHQLSVPAKLLQMVGSIPALVYAYMRWQARMNGDVYTGSLEQLSSELGMKPPLVRDCLDMLVQERLLRDITPEMGDLAHAWVVTTDA